MTKLIVACALALVSVAGEASAQSCPAYPNTLTNGTPADANQVMANFNSILTCANSSLAPAASPHLTGNVTLAAPSSGLALDVASTGRFESPNAGSTGAVVIRDSSGNPQAGYLQFVNNANSSQLGFILGLTATGLDLGGGNVGVNTSSPSLGFYVNGSADGTQAWSSASDARLKKNVETIPGALELVEQLRGVRFEWRAESERDVGKDLNLPEGGPGVGFIAQEVEKVLPEAVNAPKNPASGVYTLKESDLIPILVEAVKAQQAEIVELRTEVAALRATPKVGP